MAGGYAIISTKFLQPYISTLGGAFVFVAAFTVYVTTLALVPVPGDPSEYTFIPWILGIAHPPGYAFYTLLAALWQRLIPIGTIAYRTHLLAATTGAISATLVYSTVLTLLNKPANPAERDASSQSINKPSNGPTRFARLLDSLRATTRPASRDYPTTQPSTPLAAIFASLSFAFATDVWQHSIHINAHIVTLLLAATSVFLLVRWQATQNDRWLYAFSLVAGLSPTQHPLLVFAFPAYAAFILAVRPRILREPRNLLAMIACAAIGLSVFLYYPLRSPSTPFGVSDINSWDSFIHFVTAEGLRVNLFAFGLADQPTRLSVFFNLLQLQYPLITILLAGIGWLTLLLRSRRVAPEVSQTSQPLAGGVAAVRKPPLGLAGRTQPAEASIPGIRESPLLILLTLFFVLLYAFVINTIQDVMAYLMLPFMLIAILAGVGIGRVLSIMLGDAFKPRAAHVVSVLATIALIGLPCATAILSAPHISLSQYTAGQDWIRAVYDRFEGTGEGAFLLAPWEALTPLWVEQFIAGRKLDPRDVTLVYVAANSRYPFRDNVFAHFDLGPVYLADYRPEVVEGGLFRLRPDSGTPPLWRAVAPGDLSVPSLSSSLNVRVEGQLELLAYALDRTSLRAGETAYLTLAMRVPTTLTHVLMPYARVGDRAYRWTTDSRVLSTTWLPGEVIVERYEIALPFSTPPGDTSLALGMTDLSAGRDLTLSNGQDTIPIGALHVDPPRHVPTPIEQPILADFSAQIVLVGASASANGQSVQATLERPSGSDAWTQPLVVKPSQSIQVWLDWQALQQPLDNYKVFVHLITPGEGLAAPPADFYTPLGGAFPTQLWIPKWIEGQRVSDPYTLNIPPELPPGDYRVQIGLYGLTSNRRVYILGPDGSLAGDRVILGPVAVQPPN